MIQFNYINIYMSTIVGSNQVYGLNGQGLTGIGGYTSIIDDYYRLKILYDEIIEQLQPPKKEYVNANFDNFVNNYPDTFYNVLSVKLNDDNTFFYNNDFTLKENYEYDISLVTNWRDCAGRMINVLKQAVSEYYKIQTLENDNIELQSCKEILEDREKLIAYVEKIQTTSYLFSAQATYSSNLEIKLWYKVYLERHGPPGDGVFDSILLAEIIQELYDTNQIPEMVYIY